MEKAVKFKSVVDGSTRKGRGLMMSLRTSTAFFVYEEKITNGKTERTG